MGRRLRSRTQARRARQRADPSRRPPRPCWSMPSRTQCTAQASGRTPRHRRSRPPAAALAAACAAARCRSRSGLLPSQAGQQAWHSMHPRARRSLGRQGARRTSLAKPPAADRRGIRMHRCNAPRRLGSYFRGVKTELVEVRCSLEAASLRGQIGKLHHARIRSITPPCAHLLVPTSYHFSR